MLRQLLTFGAAAVAVLTAASPAMASPDPVQPCKSGGFVNYEDPATGQPFVNQGSCVSFVRNGGTLVRYVEEPPPPTATVETSFGPFGGNQCTWNVRLTGYSVNSTVTVDLAYINGAGFPSTEQREVTVNAEGSALFTAGFPLYGGTATATTALASDSDTVRC